MKVKNKAADCFVSALLECLAEQMRTEGDRGNNRVLLVEGTLDKEFAKKVTRHSIRCVAASEIEERLTDSDLSNADRSMKNIVRTTVYAVEKYRPFLKDREAVAKLQIYGLTDSDGMEPDADLPKRLYLISETHDLETLLLKTDRRLLQRIPDITVTEEQLKTACYIAYQLSFVRTFLRDTLELSAIDTAGQMPDYNQFVNPENCRIDLDDAVDYINRNGVDPKRAKNIRKILTGLHKNSDVRKVFAEEDGVFLPSPETFDPDEADGFWTAVNGHDVLRLLTYRLPEVKEKYYRKDRTKLKRSLEAGLVEFYNYRMFARTELYAAMKEEGLLIE